MAGRPRRRARVAHLNPRAPRTAALKQKVYGFDDRLRTWNLKHEPFPDIGAWVDANWTAPYGSDVVYEVLQITADNRSANYWGSGSRYRSREDIGHESMVRSALNALFKDLEGDEVSGAWSQSNPMGKGPYPFAQKAEQYARYSVAQLEYAAQDAWEAVKASEGWNPENEGWYRDDLATIRTELRRRGKKNPRKKARRNALPAIAGTVIRMIAVEYGMAKFNQVAAMPLEERTDWIEGAIAKAEVATSFGISKLRDKTMGMVGFKGFGAQRKLARLVAQAMNDPEVRLVAQAAVEAKKAGKAAKNPLSKREEVLQQRELAERERERWRGELRRLQGQLENLRLLARSMEPGILEEVDRLNRRKDYLLRRLSESMERARREAREPLPDERPEWSDLDEWAAERREQRQTIRRRGSRGQRRRKNPARRNPKAGDVELYQNILADLRAIQWLAWNAHWTASGPNYYGDHQLLQRLYENEGINDAIDGLGERMVAYFGPRSVDATTIQYMAQAAVHEAQHRPGSMHSLLFLEKSLQLDIKKAWKANQDSGDQMSLGLDDFLMALANQRETAIYLLRQRLGVTEPIARANPRRRHKRRARRHR